MPENQPNQDTTSNPGVSHEQSPQGTAPIGPDTWTKYIPQDLKDKGYWEPVKTANLDTVLKNYGHAQERLGRSVTVPDNPSDAEGWSKVYGKLGRPETPDGYKYELPQVEGINWDNQKVKEFHKAAHEMGLTNTQVEHFAKWVANDVKATLDDHVEKGMRKAAETEAFLKREYGPNYEMNIGIAKRASNMFFGNEATEELFATMPEPIVKGLVKLGQQLNEDKAFGSNPPEMHGVVSKEAAIKKIGEIMGDRKHPYWGNPADPNTKAALQEVEDLHKIAYPE